MKEAYEKDRTILNILIYTKTTQNIDGPQKSFLLTPFMWQPKSSYNQEISS